MPTYDQDPKPKRRLDQEQRITLAIVLALIIGVVLAVVFCGDRAGRNEEDRRRSAPATSEGGDRHDRAGPPVGNHGAVVPRIERDGD